LTDLFDLVLQTGHKYTEAFWLRIIDETLLPLFDDLNDSADTKPKTDVNEVWILTTMFPAMKHFINLYTAFPLLFKISFDTILDLITRCILQENDAISKLGSICLQDFVTNNIDLFNKEKWTNVCQRLQNLFEITTPNELFFELNDEESDGTPTKTPFDLVLSPSPQRKQFPKIILKCVLHLNIIQTVYKILTGPQKEKILRTLNKKQIFILGDALHQSYVFAQMFNKDLPIRRALLKMGFMKTLPNLVRQETSAVAAYLILLLKIYADKTRPKLQLEVEQRLIPLMYNFLEEYTSFDVVVHASSIKAMENVVGEIVEGVANLEDLWFDKNIGYFYGFFVGLLKFGIPGFIEGIQKVLERAGHCYGIQKKFEGTVVIHASLTSLRDSSDDSLDKLAKDQPAVEIVEKQHVGAKEHDDLPEFIVNGSDELLDKNDVDYKAEKELDLVAELLVSQSLRASVTSLEQDAIDPFANPIN
jgi:brefeldin A-inhibited guanine nucleotide-exchange protein